MNCLRLVVRLFSFLKFVFCAAVFVLVLYYSLGKVRAFDSFVASLAMSTSGEQFAIGANKGQITIVEARSRKTKFTLLGHKHSVAAIAFSCDGFALVSVDMQNNVIKWDLKSGLAIESYDAQLVNKICNWRISAIAFVENTSNVLVGTNGGTVQVVDFKNKKATNIMDGKGTVYLVAGSASGRVVAAVTHETNEVHVWRLGAKIERVVKISANGLTGGLAISPDDKQVAFGQMRGVLIWNLERNTKGKTFESPDFSAPCLTYAKDGLIVAGLQGREIEQRTLRPPKD